MNISSVYHIYIIVRDIAAQIIRYSHTFLIIHSNHIFHLLLDDWREASLKVSETKGPQM